jgi:carbamoyltransferase
MRALGFNAGRAAPPRIDPDKSRPLADGSAAIVVNGQIECATIEERHARRRYAGGFAASARACLGQAGIEIEQVDGFGVSTCCDVSWRKESDRIDGVIEELHADLDKDRLYAALQGRTYCVDHHDSHAMTAFVGSGFRTALVCVIDGFGNRKDDLDRFHVGKDWWRGAFDRQTYFLARWSDEGVHLERVMEASGPANGIGLAELYRSATHFLGWPSYQYAGKTMALAAYGDARRLAGVRLAAYDREIGPRTFVPDDHDDPIGQISAALRSAGYPIPTRQLRPANAGTTDLADIAAILQQQVEDCFIQTIEALVDRHNVSSVAIAGGFALNCIAMGKLAAARPDLNLYVPPAPGDTGQGLGNALWLSHHVASPLVRRGMTAPPIRSAALGPSYSRLAIDEAIADFEGRFGAEFSIRKLDSAAMADAVADLLVSQRLVALRCGRSEYGPRALGNCSILCDPRGSDVRTRVNRIKHREDFRPFAASVLAEHAKDFYELSLKSPFMSFAGKVSDELASQAPGVVHADRTSRFQTVEKEDGFLRGVLLNFGRKSGIPLVLNTSFNLSGEPMVESPSTALDVFTRSDVDAVVIEDTLIVRRATPPVQE